MPRWLPRALFFVSGAVALAEEILWVRRFTELLGATAAAAAATLGGVFLGFALGSFAGGRLGGRVRRPLRAYGALELGAAAAALALLPLLRGAEAIVPELRVALAATPAAARVIEALLTAALLVVPAACFGATLPVLAPLLGVEGGRALYAANAAGAVAGCLAVPFLVLPRFGVERGYLVVVAIGAAAGAVAWLADRGGGRRAPQIVQAGAGAGGEARARRGARALAFLSGVVLLGIEAAYARLFAQVHESSLDAFAIVVAAFLLALAAGTWLARGLLSAGLERGTAIGIAWLAAAALLAAVPLLFHAATGGLATLSGRRAERAGELVRVALLVLVPPVTLASAALPLLLGEARRVPRARELGGVLGWNTLGSIAGPLVATFVAFPAIGTFGTFAAAGALLAGGAAALLVWRTSPGPRAPALAGIAVVAVSIGALALRAPPRVRLAAENREELVELREGPLAVAAVVRSGEAACIKLDNHYVLGGTRAIGDQRQLGHLPLLLHARPRRVAFLGLGTAITAGAAVLHADVEEIVAVELVPEVATLARRHFAAANLGVLEDPRTRLVVDDARPFLRGRAGRFDVIVGDLVVPWRAGESALYTAEHFAQARAALAPGGLFCQWLPAYQLTVEQLDAIAATFLDAFPRTTLWRGDFLADLPTIALVGHLEPVDPAAVAARVVALAPRLDATSPYLVHPAGVWLFLAGELDPAAPRFRRARRHSRDFPWVELAGPTHGERGAPPLMVGAPLDALLAEAAAAPLAFGPLERLAAEELSWRSAGSDLWRASTLASAGDAAARELALATLARLPLPLRSALLHAAGNGE